MRFAITAERLKKGVLLFLHGAVLIRQVIWKESVGSAGGRWDVPLKPHLCADPLKSLRHSGSCDRTAAPSGRSAQSWRSICIYIWIGVWNAVDLKVLYKYNSVELIWVEWQMENSKLCCRPKKKKRGWMTLAFQSLYEAVENSPLPPLPLCWRCRWEPPPRFSTSARPGHAPDTWGRAQRLVRVQYWNDGKMGGPGVLLRKLTFSTVPMSGLCHVSILISKSSFMYSFCVAGKYIGTKSYILKQQDMIL